MADMSSCKRSLFLVIRGVRKGGGPTKISSMQELSTPSKYPEALAAQAF